MADMLGRLFFCGGLIMGLYTMFVGGLDFWELWGANCGCYDCNEKYTCFWRNIVGVINV